MSFCFRMHMARLIILVCLCISTTAFAEDAPSYKPQVLTDSAGRSVLQGAIEVPSQGGRQLSELEQQLQAARQLISDGNYMAASALLELLYEKNPENSAVFNLLRNSYDALQYYDKSEVLIRRQLEKKPNSFEYWLYLGQTLNRQGKTAAAHSAFTKARLQVPALDKHRLSMLIQSMVAANANSSALVLIDSLRLQGKDPTLYAVERGKIFEQQRQYGKAAIEYLTASMDPDDRQISARVNLAALLDYPESSPEAEKTLKELTKSPQQPEALKVLSQFYLKNNRFADAFTSALILDSVGKQDGKNLLFYMNACLDRKLYTQAISMARYYFPRYTESPSSIEMYFLYGDALSAAGMYDSAVATYSIIVNKSPVPADKGEALYRIGLTHLERSHRYDDALAAFDSVINNYREGFAWFNSQSRRPQVFLKKGDLAKAKEALMQAQAVQLDETNSENVQYHLGYVLFLLKEFDSSAVKLRKLTVDFPRGIYMNDALRLQLVVGDASDNPDLLGRYADAERYRVIGLPDSAKTALTDLMSGDDKRLADVACYMLADLMLKQSDTTQATGYLEQGIHDFTDSFYRPYMLKELADLKSLHLQGREAAQQLYRELLEKYPNHPYAADARKRMKALENAA